MPKLGRPQSVEKRVVICSHVRFDTYVKLVKRRSKTKGGISLSRLVADILDAELEKQTVEKE